MSKSSTVSPRPVRGEGGKVASGGLVIHTDVLTSETRERVELIDLTDELARIVRESGVSDGLVSVWSLHTTCAVFINETQAALHADIKQFLEQVVARNGNWMHNDPQHSDCDRMNADAHLRAMLLGHSLTCQISGGALVLGQWQRILAAELDGPRTRSIRVQVQGVESHS
jgi:secondary thiamine-phosphate synthase enzyme